jgi:hypothetical protein
VKVSAALAALLLATLCACTPPSGRNLPKDALDAAIGRVIGDPATCVVLVDRASGQVVYRYGTHQNCDRPLPACDRAGTITLTDTLAMIAAGPRTASCASAPGRSVGWATAHLPGTRPLDYAAFMEGERTLPGREIQSRLEGAFQDAGLIGPPQAGTR